MVLIQEMIINMIEILTGVFLQKTQLMKSLLGGERLEGRMKRPDVLTVRPVGFHDIKKVRWESPEGFSIFLSPCRVTSDPTFSLSIHSTLVSG